MINISETYTATDRTTGQIVGIVEILAKVDRKSGTLERRLSFLPTDAQAEGLDLDLCLLAELPQRRARFADDRRRSFYAVKGATANDRQESDQ